MRLPHALALIAGLLLSACGDAPGPGGTLDLATLAAPGPYAVGEAELVLVDTSRPTPASGTFPGAPERALPTRVWYPAEPAGAGAPVASDGPFPIVGWAHGFSSTNVEGAFVGSHLASHGYVVVAPSFPLSNGGAPGGPTIGDMTNQPADLDFVMRQVASGAAGEALAAAVDVARRGIAGFSLGGGTVLIAAYHPTWRIENVSVAMALAPASCFFGSGLYGPSSVPMLILTGDGDMLVPIEGGPAHAFQWTEAPIEMLTLHGGNHVGFIGIDGEDGHNPDATVGCPVIGRGGSVAVGGIGALSTLLQEGVGPSAFDPRSCPSSCIEDLPRTMSAEWQLEITRAAALAHFDAVLRGRRNAARWLESTIASEAPDLSVAIRR